MAKKLTKKFYELSRRLGAWIMCYYENKFLCAIKQVSKTPIFTNESSLVNEESDTRMTDEVFASKHLIQLVYSVWSCE